MGVAIIWGVNIPFMKIGLGLLANVYVFNALRLPVSALVLSLFAMRESWHNKAVKKPEPPKGVRIGQIVIYSLTVSVMYQLVFLVGMNHTTPGNAALILATVPMWTAVAARLFIAEHLKMLAWIGLSIALAGTVVVAFQSNSVSAEKHLLFGNLMMCLAAVLWASGTVYSKPLLERITPLRLAAISSVMGLPAHLLVAFFVARTQDVPVELGQVKLWLIVLFSGSLSSGLAQPMWHFGVRRAGAAHAAIVQNLVPLVAIFAAWAISDIRPTMAQGVGGALILAGLLLMRWSRS